MNFIPKRSRVATQAQFSSEYEKFKNLFLNCINDGQWAKIEIEFRSLTHSERAHSSKPHSQLDVHAAELSQVSIQSFTEVSSPVFDSINIINHKNFERHTLCIL